MSPHGVTAYFRDYEVASSEARTPLLEQAEQCLRDLLEYCQKHEINLLLVEAPYIILHEKDVTETNTMADIAAEYSVPFLNYNTREVYEEIDLDFETDIYDCNHVNCLGARKYTEQFAAYLHEHYSLKDHRNDDSFSTWEELYQEGYLPFMEVSRDRIEKEAESIKAALNQEAAIRSSEDVSEWLSLTKNPNLTILFSLNAQSEKEKTAYRLCFDRFKKFSEATQECVGTITNGEISFYEGSKAFSGTINMPTGVPQIKYTISRDCADSIICVNEKEYKNEEKNGIHAVVFNNNTREIIDTVRILEYDGNIELIHLPL